MGNFLNISTISKYKNLASLIINTKNKMALRKRFAHVSLNEQMKNKTFTESEPDKNQYTYTVLNANVNEHNSSERYFERGTKNV